MGQRRTFWITPHAVNSSRPKVKRLAKPRSGLCSNCKGISPKTSACLAMEFICPCSASTGAILCHGEDQDCKRLEAQVAHVAYSPFTSLPFHGCCSEKEKSWAVYQEKKNRACTQKEKGRLGLKKSHELERLTMGFC